MRADAAAGGAGGALDLGVPRRIHVVGIGGAGMSAIALVLRAMGHRVSGSDLKDSPVAERLRSHGISVAVGHRPENVAGAEAVTFSPAVPAREPRAARSAGRGHARRSPLRNARRHLRHAALPCRRGDAWEDDDSLHAVADPGGGRAAAVVPSSGPTSTRSGRTRCGTRGSGSSSRLTRATGRSRPSAPTWPCSPTSSRTTSTTTAPSPPCGAPSPTSWRRERGLRRVLGRP